MDTHNVMDLATCAYCGWPGLVMSVKLALTGFDVTGKCQICDSTYDSLNLSAGLKAGWSSAAPRPMEQLAQD